MLVDILSDPICPWCYIGKKQLETAQETYARLPQHWESRWRVFQLNPHMPQEGMDRQLYLQHKFGGPGAADQVYERIRQTGLEIGIDFQFDQIKTTPNTMRAHRLIRLAASHGDPKPLVERLFEAYFLEGIDIGNINELAFLAAESGLDRDGVTTFLMSDELSQELQSEDQEARRAGVSGVPFFVIENKYALSGAQPPKAFHRVFDLHLDGDARNDA